MAREGTKKTVFTNFMELCKSMNRNHEHVQAYLLAELGTSGAGGRAGGRAGGEGGRAPVASMHTAILAGCSIPLPGVGSNHLMQAGCCNGMAKAAAAPELCKPPLPPQQQRGRP